MKTKQNSIFSKMYVSLECNNYVSLEEFSMQEDDYILDTLQKEFLRLKEVIVENKIKKPTNVFKNKVCTSILSRIETLIVDRFGVQIKFAGNNEEEDIFKSLLLPPTTLEINKIDFSKSDSLLKEVKKIEDSWNTKGVTIDNEKIKVQGLPKDYDIIILSNFMLMLEKDFTEVDMSILLINEIGKIFHYIRLSYNPLRETKDFYDNLHNLIYNKNMEPKRALSETYINITGDKSLDVSNNNIFTATMIILRKYISYVMNKFKNFNCKEFINKFKVKISTKLDTYLETRKLLNSSLNTFLTTILAIGLLAIILYIGYILMPFTTVLVTVMKLFGLFILGSFLLYLLGLDREHERNKKNTDTLTEIKDILKENSNTFVFDSIIKNKLILFKNSLFDIFNSIGTFSKNTFSTMFNLGMDNKINTQELDAVQTEIQEIKN